MYVDLHVKYRLF